MTKPIIAIIFVLTSAFTSAQSKHDANWCFSFDAGINFSDTNNPVPFKTLTWNNEATASFSDSLGDLLFYLKFYLGGTSAGYNYCEVVNSNHQLIANGDSIEISYSATNGALIINSPGFDNKFYLFQVALINGTCYPTVCYNLKFSILEIDANGILSVTVKNQLIVADIEEKLCAVKHANGKDWWILAHARAVSGNCTNRYYKFLVTENGIGNLVSQDIGTLHCGVFSEVGEAVLTRRGDVLACAIYGEGVVDFFDFDRCIGELSNHRAITGLEGPYGCAFSPNGQLLYLTCTRTIGNGKLYQFHLGDTGSGIELWTNSILKNRVAQMELAPDDKIYLNIYGYPNQPENKNLSVINLPDSAGLACNFQPNSFYLGDSVRTLGGLPNMPNYNLGAIGVYQARAALEDTLILCSRLTSSVTLGVPHVEHIIYSWSPSIGLNDTAAAQPVASTLTDTWYYLTVTDTAPTTSCNTRVDSVFVKVVDSCTTGMSASPAPLAIHIYPNPANDFLYIFCDKALFIKTASLIDITGKTIQVSFQPTFSVSNLPRGVYFVKVDFANGRSVIDKVVINY